MMEFIQTFVPPLLLLLGSFFCISGGVGVLRFPDFFTRMHAAGVTDTLGAGLILGALMFMTTNFNDLGKLVLILLFALITSPTASHALAKSAVRAGIPPKSDDEVTVEVRQGGARSKS
ncbi:MAG: monovalent cation/H(+) antiporter subunit G [Pseudomonadales bacterium]